MWRTLWNHGGVVLITRLHRWLESFIYPDILPPIYQYHTDPVKIIFAKSHINEFARCFLCYWLQRSTQQSSCRRHEPDVTSSWCATWFCGWFVGSVVWLNAYMSTPWPLCKRLCGHFMKSWRLMQAHLWGKGWTGYLTATRIHCFTWFGYQYHREKICCRWNHASLVCQCRTCFVRELQCLNQCITTDSNSNTITSVCHMH